MRIALIGNGKTGHFVTEICRENNYSVTVFDSKTPFTSEASLNSDVVICFTTGNILESYIEELIESKLPIVIASTGYDFTGELKQKLETQSLKWIYSSNFSTSLFIYKSIIQLLGSKAKLDELDDLSLEIVDIHHKDKVDAPSGTALSIKEWFGSEVAIKSLRLDDHIGTHKFILSSRDEEIEVIHTIKSRKVFASGAITAAKILLNTNRTGLIKFYEVINE
jgi:4-hydroxy-tetrahydrodipicolinate reductase